MTNLMDDTETTGRRLFEPIALALLAAGGMTASVARSDGGGEQPGLIVPPITAQAHAAGSPAPEAEALAAAPAALPPQTGGVAPDEAAGLTVEPAAAKPAPSPSAPHSNRFAEVFAEVGAAPASLALERADPGVAIAIAQPESAGLSAKAEPAAPVAVISLVPEASDPALQLVATQPVPAATPVSAAPVAVMDSPQPALAMNAVPGAEPVPLAIAPAAAAEPIRLAAAPAVAAIEAVARLDSPAPAPAVEPLLAPAAAPQAAPAALVESAAPAAATPGLVAPAVAEASVEAPKPAFVSEPVVQTVTATAVTKPIAPVATPSAVAAPAPKAEPVARLAKTKAPRTAPLGGAIGSNFQLNDGTIDYRIGARVNGGEPASLPLRITRDDQLSVKLGDLLALVKPQMDPALYAYLAASRGADEYVTFATIRSTGIDIRYDAARDQLLLGVE